MYPQIAASEIGGANLLKLKKLNRSARKRRAHKISKIALDRAIVIPERVREIHGSNRQVRSFDAKLLHALVVFRTGILHDLVRNAGLHSFGAKKFFERRGDVVENCAVIGRGSVK